MMQSLGENLKQARKEKGMTQLQLAEAVFVTRQTISNWENGRSEPDLDMLRKLAEQLEIDLEAVFGVEKPQEEAAPEIIEEPVEQAEETVVQPWKLLWKRYWWIAAAVMIALGLVNNLFFSTPDYTIEWFQQPNIRHEGHAWMEIHAKANHAQIEKIDESGNVKHVFAMFFRDEGGVGMQVEKITLVAFFKDGSTWKRIYTREDISTKAIGSYIGAYKMLRMNGVVERDVDQEVEGVGVHIYTTDDKELKQEFRHYFTADEI